MLRFAIAAPILAVMALLAGGSARAQCSLQQANATFTAVDNITSWSDLTGFYSDHRKCDDGDISDGVSGAVGRLMTEDWAGINTVNEEVRNDPVLARWIVDHVDGTWSQDDLNAARESAAHRCPPGLEAFCYAVVLKVDAPY